MDNYCRNADGQLSRPWCWIDAIRSEECDILSCGRYFIPTLDTKTEFVIMII